MASTLKLDKENSEDLQELFLNREPGQRISLTVSGEILENSEKDVVIEINEVDHDMEDETEEDDDEAEPSASAMNPDVMRSAVTSLMTSNGERKGAPV